MSVSDHSIQACAMVIAYQLERPALVWELVTTVTRLATLRRSATCCRSLVVELAVSWQYCILG